MYDHRAKVVDYVPFHIVSQYDHTLTNLVETHF